MPMTLLFDTWGTLVDNYSIADVIEPYVGEAHTAQDIAQDWRAHQKWAMFYTTLADAFVPHPSLNEACLRWSLDKNHVELSEAAIKDIVDNYHKLRAYPDVIGALKSLKQQGHVLKIVANPTKKMIEEHSKFAGTYPYPRRDNQQWRRGECLQAIAQGLRTRCPSSWMPERSNPLGHRTFLGNRWGKSPGSQKCLD